MRMTRRSLFGFGDIVIVEENLVGIIVKVRGPAQDKGFSYEIYVRSWNGIRTYMEEEVTRIIYHKELSDEDLEYYN